jgi:hypothetical protein
MFSLLPVSSFRRSMVLPVLLLGAAVGLLLSGCSEGTTLTTQVRPQQVQPLDSVAVVSVRAAKRYENKIERGPADTAGVRHAVHAITEMSERQARRADPRYRAVAEQVRDDLFGRVEAVAPFTLVQEDRVLRSDAYREGDDEGAAHGDNWRSSLFATPDGYRGLDPARFKGGRLAQSFLGNLPSTPDGVLFAETTFALVARSGGQGKGATLGEGDTVEVDVEATVQIQVLARTGNTALTVARTGQSDDGFTFVYGQGWEARQIDGPAQRATQRAVEKITSYMKKKVPGSTLAEAARDLRSSKMER